MFPPKTVLKFGIIAAIVYSVLTLGWHSLNLKNAYAPWFRGFGNVAFSQFWFWSQATVEFIDAEAPDLNERVNGVLPGRLPEGFQVPGAQRDRDTLLVLMNRNAPGTPGFFRTASRITGYAPTAVMISIALATPIIWRRRLWTLGWGLVLIHAFILARLTIILLHAGFAVPDKAYALFRPGPFMRDVLKRADVVLADNPTFSYLVPVFFWVMILFGFQIKDTLVRRRNLEAGDPRDTQKGVGKRKQNR